MVDFSYVTAVQATEKARREICGPFAFGDPSVGGSQLFLGLSAICISVIQDVV